MSCDSIQKDDIGVEFRLTILNNGNALDVSSATTKQILFKKPNGDTLTKTASFYTDGTDGILKYLSQSGDLDVTGTWQIQAYVVITAGTFHSNIETFSILKNLV